MSSDRLGTGCNVVCTASARIFAPRYHRVHVFVCFSFYSFCSFLIQGNPRVKGGKALGCIYKGLWTLGVEKGSAVHWREEFGSRTDTTYLLFVFLRTAVRRLDTGCLLLAHWPRGVRTKAGLFFLVGTSGLHLKDISRLHDSMFVCEYLDMYDRERMGDILLPM